MVNGKLADFPPIPDTQYNQYSLGDSQYGSHVLRDIIIHFEDQKIKVFSVHAI